jgi:hypothetical protein
LKISHYVEITERRPVDQRIKKKGKRERKNKSAKEEWVKMSVRMVRRSGRIRRK